MQDHLKLDPEITQRELEIVEALEGTLETARAALEKAVDFEPGPLEVDRAGLAAEFRRVVRTK